MGMQITSDRIALMEDKTKGGLYYYQRPYLPDGTTGGTEVLLKIPIIH